MKRAFRVLTALYVEDYPKLLNGNGGLNKQSCVGRFRSRRAAVECAYQHSEDRHAFIFRRTKNGWKLVDWF